MVFEDVVKQSCLNLIDELQLPEEFLLVVEQVYLPLAGLLLDKINTHNRDESFLVSINGAQGTGKSTLVSFLKLILQQSMQQPVAAFSLDDFYLTYEQRQQLAKQVHPLLATRGVPGTHDLLFLEDTLDALLHQKPCMIPSFNKAADDRHEPEHWLQQKEGASVILFEGWCNHSPVQTAEQLKQPLNQLESEEDQEGVWRHYANEQLQEYHDRIFCYADYCLMLQPPGFEHVYEWRRLQEKKLRENQENDLSARTMNDDELIRFIQHYERITRHSLEYLPQQADVLLPVDANHAITGIMQSDDDG